MLNAERFKEKILDVVEDDKKYDFAIKDDDPNAFYNCHSDIPCKNCIFTSLNNGKNCLYNRFNWLLSEYKEPVKVSGLEHELLKFWYESGCCYRYIARDSSGNLFLYVRIPTKKAEVWASIEWHKFISDFNDLFKFIQWEDSEPTSIEYVLKNCEVVEDAEEL